MAIQLKGNDESTYSSSIAISANYIVNGASSGNGLYGRIGASGDWGYQITANGSATYTGDVFVKTNDNEQVEIEPAGVIKLKSTNAAMATADALRVTNASSDIARIGYNGLLTLGTINTGSGASAAKGVQAFGSSGQLVVQGSSGETAGNQVMFAVYTGSSKQFEVYNNGNVMIGSGNAIQLYSNGTIVSAGTFSTTAPNPRPLFVGNDGVFGGVSSVRASKKDIDYDYDSSWIYDLKPVSFKYRKQDKETKAYTAETYDEGQYGLIAEDVEEVNREICNYDDDKLLGVNYHKLITPILSELQQALTRIEALEARINELEAK